ncbi:MAG TPA: toprim domain-containing protein [Methylomirabilota bacterium]|nr:toprim domain-containing protein [Methylomirabilota bacterium]
MRAPPGVRLERFQQLIDQVAFESSNGSTIVVEGQKDRESLRKIGITGPIHCIQSSRQNAVGFAETLGQTKKVVILTDFDREGISLANKLSRTLNAHSVHVNLVLWKSLRELTRSHVRSIEELPKYLEWLRNETNNPTRRNRRTFRV